MSSNRPDDQYAQFSDASTTPFWDLFVGLVTLATVAGGGLAAVYAIGYFLNDKAAQAWPLTGTFAVLVVANLALRIGRSRARRSTASPRRRARGT